MNRNTREMLEDKKHLERLKRVNSFYSAIESGCGLVTFEEKIYCVISKKFLDGIDEKIIKE